MDEKFDEKTSKEKKPKLNFLNCPFRKQNGGLDRKKKA